MEARTPTVEEYLEAIFNLEERLERSVKTSELAKELKTIPSAVTEMVKRLANKGLITHKPYRGISLTSKGRRLGIKIVRRHRLSERLLTDILQVNLDRAHEEACKLEHAISKETEEKIDEILGHPETCPHGAPIPTVKGEIKTERSEALASLRPTEKGVVARVAEEPADLLHYFSSLGVIPGAPIEIVEKAPFGGPLIVKVKGARFALSHGIASKIWVHSRGPSALMRGRRHRRQRRVRR